MLERNLTSAWPPIHFELVLAFGQASVIQRYGIDAAQHLAGHRNVVATSAYSKRRLRDQDITRMLNYVLNPQINR